MCWCLHVSRHISAWESREADSSGSIAKPFFCCSVAAVFKSRLVSESLAFIRIIYVRGESVCAVHFDAAAFSRAALLIWLHRRFTTMRWNNPQRTGENLLLSFQSE